MTDSETVIGHGNEDTHNSMPDWKRQLQEAVREIAVLERLLELPPGSLADAPEVIEKFPLLVPRAFVARMKKSDPGDPLLRQVLPIARENTVPPGFSPDPLGERGLALNGSISKYPGRILLVTTGACPVHCRYCFRREFPYSAQNAARGEWTEAIRSIRDAANVSEVILSGGDPLSLSNERLERLLLELQSIPKLRTVRIHTRFPVVLPARVDQGLIQLLGDTRLNTVIVIHANHPAEIDATVARAARDLKQSCELLLNQSVLLRGINDDADTLIALSEALLQCGITPYYLHLLDRVAGSAHFEVSESDGANLVDTMRRRAPGYLVPKLVRDQFGELSKTPVS